MSDFEKSLKFLELIGFSEVRVNSGVFMKERENLEDKEVLVDELEELKKEVLKCEKCRLAKTRTNVVFGEGNPKAKLMFVGEAPGEQEDLQGRPFVGRAGQLLTRFLNLFGVDRERVYITNIVKCRPPKNRNPEIDEIKSCFPYLYKQIEIIKPKVIVCLGAFAARTILNLPDKTPISKIRGQEFLVNGITVIPTYHPAYLLRNRRGESDFQRDLELALRKAGMI